jgi:DNA-directed RNA polymerase subunit M
MEFCPKCGCILVEKRKNFGCQRCNYTAKGKVKIESTEELKERDNKAVVKKEDTNVMPVVSAKCPRCGNKEAYFWTAQTRAADEAETKFFKCKKCEHTWREYR